MSGKYINRLPRGMPADQTRALSDVFQDLHRDATQYQATANNAVVRPQREKLDEFVSAKDFGAVGDGTADDTTALSNWIAHLKTQTAPKGILPYGDYLISSTLTLDLPDYSTIEWNGRVKCGTSITGTAIRLGSTSTNIFGLTIGGGGVDIRRTTDDTSGSSEGCEIRNLVWSKVRVRLVRGFSKGLLLNGTQSNGGVSHCRVDLGDMRNNRHNVFLTASGDGYCNENSLYGGSFGFTSDWNGGTHTNTFDIYEDYYSTHPLNNNKFFGPSLESYNTSTVAAQIYGQHTHIYAPRLETATGTATNLKLVFATESQYCLVTSGQNVLLANITDNGTSNRFLLDDYTTLPNGTKYLVKSLGSDANYTLTEAEYLNHIIRFDSSVSLTATRNMVVPLTPRQWTIWNNTTGAQSIQIIGATGTGITIANGKHAIVYANGANVIRVTPDT